MPRDPRVLRARLSCRLRVPPLPPLPPREIVGSSPGSPVLLRALGRCDSPVTFPRMCLIAFAHDAHPAYRLVLAANRDEFYDRPTAPAAWWKDAPQVLAGRDLRAGGTWMGVTRDGRFAAVTNFRESAPQRADALSRGDLVADFLRGATAAKSYVWEVA